MSLYVYIFPHYFGHNQMHVTKKKFAQFQPILNCKNGNKSYDLELVPIITEAKAENV